MLNRIEKNNLESKHYYFLLGVIIFCVLIQSLFLFQKKYFVIDEENSILLATGKLSSYKDVIFNKKYPYGELVDIGEYKDFFKVDQEFCFNKISRETASVDIHPPLYFWLLHIWIIMTGGQAYIWTGNVLNLIIAMFIIILLFKLTFEFFHSFEDALFSTILFSLSPSLYSSNHARPYFLLTLITLLTSYFFINIINKDNKISLARILGLSILICLGLLCHYTFIFICISWFIFIVIHYSKENKRLIFYFIFSCLIGFLFFCNIYPDFTSNLINYNVLNYKTFNNSFFSTLQKLTLDLKISKIMIHRLGTFFSEHQKLLIASLLTSGQLFYYIFITVSALLLLSIWFSIKKDKVFGLVFASFLYPLLFMTLFFLNKKSLPWIVYDKYFLFILPFLFLCIIFFLKKKLFYLKKIILVCLCQILFFSTFDNLIEIMVNDKNMFNRSLAFHAYVEEMQALNNEKYIVLDNSVLEIPGLGINRLLRVYNVPEKTKILVADSRFLLSNYPNYFGSKSVLFPFIYITYFDNTTQRKIASRVLLKKIMEDKNIKLTLEIAFYNLSGEGEMAFKVDKVSIK